MLDDRTRSRFSRFKAKARLLMERRNNPPASVRNLNAITRHIEKCFGSNFFVLHERKSTTVHIDVNVILPSPTQPYYSLLTSGMSDLGMQGARGPVKLAEVCLSLPSDWPISKNDMEWATPEYFWPIAVLKQVARYPHLHGTTLSRNHTIGSIDRPEPIDPAGRFVGLILREPVTLPKGAEQLKTDDGRDIKYLGIIPLFRDELAFKLEHGSGALEDKLSAANVTELLNTHRQSVISVSAPHQS
jgi:hypothetical protein